MISILRQFSAHKFVQRSSWAFLLCSLFALCTSSALSADLGLDNTHLSVGTRYDYTQQTGSSQIIGELTLFATRRELSAFDASAQILNVNGGVFIDSAGRNTGRWGLRLASLHFAGSLWNDVRGDTSYGPIDNVSHYINYKKAIGLAVGATVLDINGTDRSELVVRWLQARMGAFVRFRFGMDIDIGVTPVIGLTSYKLGDLAYGSLGPKISTNYFGFEAGAQTMVRFTHRGASLALEAESQNIFAGRTVNFLTVGAKATIVLPQLPIVESWLVSAGVEHENASFDDRSSTLTQFRIGITAPFFIKGRTYDPWL